MHQIEKLILFMLGCVMIFAGIAALIASHRVAIPAVDSHGDIDQNLIDNPQEQTVE